MGCEAQRGHPDLMDSWWQNWAEHPGFQTDHGTSSTFTAPPALPDPQDPLSLAMLKLLRAQSAP